jgi:TIR domain
MPQSGGNPVREHLLINYATEDWALAEWLTRKLTAEGYRVWCDRFKLLGGESYPKEIDDAIKSRTFRMLSLLSRASLTKPNPLKERTLGLNIAKERREDFVVPLNVDGLKPTELDWMTSDLTFIPFSHGWAPGLRQLLDKLQSINTPRPLANGREIAASTFLSGDVVRNEPELIYSNIFRATLPNTLRRFRVSPGIPLEERDALLATWPFYAVSPTLVLAFDNPNPAAVDGRAVTLDGTLPWGEMFDINGIRTRSIITALLRGSMAVKALALGLRLTPNRRAMYFPEGLVPEDKLWFRGYAGEETYVRVTGERTLWQPLKIEKYRYYLAADIRARTDIPPGYVVQITPTIHVTSPVGEPLLDRTINSRRKHVSKTWTNHHWLNRLFALAEFLAGGTDAICLGSVAEAQVVISAKPITMSAPVSINEAALDMAESPGDEEGSSYDRADDDEGDDNGE